ncbi:MAG TPA: hypothetical protein VNJ54_11480, partial [Plantibacter sp.]|uniref:hypothetical protein n=1 Tax=Plantibacter sp. TaxID=1871045 RepID=UPI002B9D8787|nr:hypothetical protein [Plantibacter sp.]
MTPPSLAFEINPIVSPMCVIVKAPGYCIGIGGHTIAVTADAAHARRICELLNEHGSLAVP